MQHYDLDDLLAHVTDSEATERFVEAFYDQKKHSKALLQFVYADKRAGEYNRYFDQIYHESYSAVDLEKRPFINFGPGSFRHKYWTTADKIYAANDGKLWSESRGKDYREAIDFEWDMYKRQPLEVDDGTYAVAYGSHIIEHAYNEDDQFFFEDVYRLLRKGGVFRLTAPNIDLGLRAAKTKDYSYYGQHQYMRGGVHRQRVLGPDEKRLPIEYFVVEQACLLTRKENSTYITPEQCPDFLWSNPDVYKTLDEASRLSDRSLNEKVAAHVNWFNMDKIVGMLKQAGFKDIFPSAYGQSVCPILRDVRLFDNTNPLVSFYVDAVK